MFSKVSPSMTVYKLYVCIFLWLTEPGGHTRVWRPELSGGYRGWKDMNNQREFFDSFAAERNFDPLIPENWYSFTKRDIKGVRHSLVLS